MEDEDDDDIEAKYNLANYDDDDDDDVPPSLANMSDLMYYEDNSQDPNLQAPKPPDVAYAASFA